MTKESIRRNLCALKYYFFERKKAKDYYSTCCFDYYKCIFIHIPKCAGTSISRALFGNNGGGHTSIMQYQRVFPEKTLKNYFKFTFVRNPYTRLFSAFQYMKKGGRNEKDRIWAKQFMKFDTFDEFVCEGLQQFHIINYLHFRPQVSFLVDDRGTLQVDFIGRYEQLVQDFEKVKKKVNPKAKLIHVNKGSVSPTDWKKHFSPNMIKRINEVYQFDFSVLGYDTLK